MGSRDSTPQPDLGAPPARRLWCALEPIHAVAQYSPEPVEARRALGLEDPVASRFVDRLAPLAPLDPRVRLAVAGWHVGSALERTILRGAGRVRSETLRPTMLHALDQAFWRIYGTDLIRADELVSASQLARRVAERADCRSRPLAASQQCLDWPTFPHLVLWQAASVLCEHRAAGRKAVLISEGLTALEGHVLDVAQGVSSDEAVRLGHGVSRSGWETAVSGLSERGLVSNGAKLTSSGAVLCASIDDRTDLTARQPLTALSDAEVERLFRLLAGFTTAVQASGDLDMPMALGLPPLLGSPPLLGPPSSSQGPSVGSVRAALLAGDRSGPGLSRAERFFAASPRAQRRRPAALR